MHTFVEPNTLEQVTGQMLLIVLTGLMLGPYTDLNFKWRELATIMPFLLVNEVISMRILKIL